MSAIILFQYLWLDPIKNLGLSYPLKHSSGSGIQESCPWKTLLVIVDTWDSLGFRNLSFSGQKYPEAFIDLVLHILSLVLVLLGCLCRWLPKMAAGPCLVGGFACSTSSFSDGKVKSPCAVAWQWLSLCQLHLHPFWTCAWWPPFSRDTWRHLV